MHADYQNIALVLTPEAAQAGDGVFVNIDVNTAPVGTQGSTLESYSAYRRRLLLEMARNNPEFSVSDETLAGFPAKRMEATLQYGPKPLRVRLLCVVRNNIGYTITTAARADAFDAWDSRFEALLSSFKLNTK